ncbi:hypothetical protein COY90_01395 [Candidatus Roizmanbacteria bacterium CG_4_10_14_0_8_um_filter_39_9]|uniref:Prolipoprotein diacylglyceryl transferase n=1 Tax=Candidatus Roizmanbacteria bacterium CG_4_10_14_0_8_um_filter_39_9 TaxID=1974829 RepID=A0A2M7QDJ5_9BACT|nr:MAG: hypothetical protein COY90_01395 [Candidatus Roizmanbacteria bacterium CG_4_10_14_0_8_um_filter_39_9]
MLPVLLNFGFVKIYTMGVFLVLAFFWASFVLWKVIRLSSYKEGDVFDMLFGGILSGLFFGRLVYVIMNFGDFGFNILRFILINGYPGLSLYGAIIGFILSLLLSSYLRKIVFTNLVDYYIPSSFLAVAIGKLGSFFSGSEAGLKTTFLLSVRYGGLAGARHLTPLYEALFFFAGAAIAYRLLFEIRREKYRSGFTLSFFAWYTGAVYFIFDNLKQDHLYFLGYSFNKIMSGVLLLTFSFYFVYYFRSHIIKQATEFKSLIFTYVKNTYQVVHRKTKKTAGEPKTTNS